MAEAENISATSISRRLPVKNEKDELGELATTFNDLLSRLEESFNSQKMFVSNVSHELRTPLAALMAELGITLQKERTPQQYRDALDNVMNDARRMNSLIDGLLNLAKADYGKEQISMQEIRLDELLLDVANVFSERTLNIRLNWFLMNRKRMMTVCHRQRKLISSQYRFLKSDRE